MEVLDSLGKRFSASGKTVVAVIGLFLLGVILGLGGSLIKLEILSITLGCLAGVLWLTSGYITFNEILPQEMRDRLDLRGNWLIGRRRWVMGWALLSWLLILELTGHWMPKAILGALNVAVILTLWRIATPTAFERNLEEENEKAAAIWVENQELEEPGE